VTVWSLAKDGSHGPLRFGVSEDDVIRDFGAPNDDLHDKRHGLNILKYDAVELHFKNHELFLVHCEFGSRPLPPAVASEKLGLAPGPLFWPLDEEALRSEAAAVGLGVQTGSRSGMRELRFGLATVLIADDDQLAAWAVTRPEG